jgi:hypothetical protein
MLEHSPVLHVLEEGPGWRSDASKEKASVYKCCLGRWLIHSAWGPHRLLNRSQLRKEKQTFVRRKSFCKRVLSVLAQPAASGMSCYCFCMNAAAFVNVNQATLAAYHYKPSLFIVTLRNYVRTAWEAHRWAVHLSIFRIFRNFTYPNARIRSY